ncbi:hypothetical protein K2173_000050 [Erythroxylum novogranatense]|uniref:Stress response NST1-like protein n=1 Tax=Erythroxylum novogranatense TaxID=1862640 RepID=A0AAV8SP62_9ROSI|nr:hypothetical protein K2173_000050 [Erythroxylum novogranatense]
MCILCVIQKWSRRVATMLPWLIIPLIGLWALSQLLPPAFRFEITSPRLACVFVLLVTLFWYEILMPQLSTWRVRRNARLRERKRFEAIELQKLRKTATRKCRNCLTPYRDQNPGGGRFMCSYCGHISKRPVLDMPVPPGLISNSGIIKDLVGKGGKLLNGKVWSDNGWMCNQDWLENGNWVGGSVTGMSTDWRKDGNGIFGGDDNCFAEKSYSRVVIFTWKLLTSFFLSLRWLWRKLFRVSSSLESTSSDAEHRGMLSKRGENGANYHESRGEKARRKAEEKRQARLERELLEEEERKQREEVARLVEERRRLRDEKLEAEKDRSKSSPPVREKDGKKESEKRRQERRKEKDKGSSKSNSDAEELEKKSGKDSVQKLDLEKKNDSDREHHKSAVDSVKAQNFESLHGIKNNSTSNFNRGAAGNRYLDRMKGTLFSSSRAFSGSGFFGKTVNTPATTTKEHKFASSVDHVHTSVHRRDIGASERISGKSSINGDDKSDNRTVLLEPQQRMSPKKSWHQLFTRSSSALSANANAIISRPNAKPQKEGDSPQLTANSSVPHTFDNPINFGLPSPFVTAYPNVSSSTSLGFSPPIEPIFPHVFEGPHQSIPEEPELFEDPCYVPDPITLLGPVSESLDNFQLDMGTGFASDKGMEKPYTLKNISASPEVSKPSPIESPLSRLRITDEKHNGSNWFSSTSKAQDLQTPPRNDVHVNDNGTWHMWNSSPLGQDSILLVGGAGSWLTTPGRSRLIKEDVLQPSSQNTTSSLFSKDDQILSGTHCPQKIFLGNGQNGGAFSPVNLSKDTDHQVQNAYYRPFPGNSGQFSLKSLEDGAQNEMTCGNPNGPAINHSFELNPTSSWSRKEWSVPGSTGGVGNSSITGPNIGGLFPTRDVQSLWSFDR